VAPEQPVAANQTWAVDFIHDSLVSGRHFRAFAVLDQWGRENLAIEVHYRLLLTYQLDTTRGKTSSVERSSPARR